MAVEAVRLPAGIPLLDGSGHLAFRQIHQDFGQTPYGRYLEQNVRYDNNGKGYKPASVSNEQWLTALGYDVCNRRHGWHQFRLAQILLSYEGDQYSPDDQRGVLLTGLSHDWGETDPHLDEGEVQFPQTVRMVGDVRYGQKTDDDEQLEEQILLALGDHYLTPKVGPEWIRRVAANLADKTTPTGELFMYVERMGYTLTGIRAWQEAHHPDRDYSDEMRSGLYRLGWQVTTNHLPSLVEAAAKFEGVGQLLLRKAETIDRIVEHVAAEKTQLPSAWQNFQNANQLGHQPAVALRPVPSVA